MREQRRLLDVHQHRDDDLVEQARAPLDDVDVAVGQRIERARIDGKFHDLIRVPCGPAARPGVKRQRAVARHQVPRHPQPPDLLRRRPAARVLEHEQSAGRHQGLGRGNRGRQIGFVVRRIQHGQIERSGRHGSDFASVSDNSIAVRDAAVTQVLFDELQRARIGIDERHVRRAAAERLDADRARARVEVEHARAGHARARRR